MGADDSESKSRWRSWKIWTPIIFILSAAIGGIIGELTNRGFFWILPLLSGLVLKIAWPSLFRYLIILIVFVAVLFIVVRRCSSDRAYLTDELEKAADKFDSFTERFQRATTILETAASVIQLDDSLLRLLPGLVSAEDRDLAMRNLLVEILRDSTRVFSGQVSRASIFRPEGEFLVPWVLDQLATYEGRRFYIGADSLHRRGVAGEAFVDRSVKVVHLSKVDEIWQADDNAYVVFDQGRPHPPYRSFVAIPLIATTTNCLGVGCFDSMDEHAFDPPEIQDFLRTLGRRIAFVILVYQHFKDDR